MNEFCKLGLKIVGALLAGGAVFVGLDKAFSSESKSEVTENNQPTSENCNNSENCSCNSEKPIQRELTAGEKAVNCLKKTQDTCSRALNVIQNITVAVDSIVKVFNNKGPSIPSYGYGGYYNNYGYNDTPPGFRRISPCILEYVGDPGSRNNNTNNNNVWGY